jgi:hypothetical protein
MAVSQVHNMRVNDSGYLECYLEYIDYDGEGKQIFTSSLLC